VYNLLRKRFVSVTLKIIYTIFICEVRQQIFSKTKLTLVHYEL